jgi:hypothetical protein
MLPFNHLSGMHMRCDFESTTPLDAGNGDHFAAPSKVRQVDDDIPVLQKPARGYHIQQFHHMKDEVIASILLKHFYSCFQMIALLESTSARYPNFVSETSYCGKSADLFGNPPHHA